MFPQSHEYEVVWTGTMEVALAKAQQIQPEPRPSAPSAPTVTTLDIVRQFIAEHPDKSMREIAAGTGLHRNFVEDAAYALSRRNVIVRTNPPCVNRRVPIRWRVR